MSAETKNTAHNRRPERHVRDTLSGIVTGIVFILAGGFILAENQGLLFDSWLWWFLLTTGIVLIVEAGIRTRVEKYNRPVISTVIWGGILSTIGAMQIYDVENWWPLILVFVGIVLILHSLRQPTGKHA